MRCVAVGLTTLGLVLSGCNDDTQQPVEAQGGSADLHFSYPTQGQQSTPTSAPVFLRFDGEVSTSEDALGDGLLLKEKTGQGEEIAFDEVKLLDEGRGLRADPETALTPGRSYELSVSGISVGDQLLNETIEFSTAASDIGPIIERTDLTADTSDFSVARILPYADEASTAVGDGTDTFPLSDLSTFRIQFNEPVNENTLSYGLGDNNTIRLTDSEGNLVPAEMLARDHRLTLDPDEDLDPGETYKLSLSSDIKSRIGGASLETPDSPWTFTPMASTSPSGERSVITQKATTDAGKLALTGEDYNSVRLSATTLGDASANQTIQTGTVFAELGYIPSFDQAGKSVPLSIDRGTLMKGSSVAVKVGGEVPSGFESETIDVRFLSDANGYLMPNPYTSDPSAPRLVRLFLDLGMNTGDPRANGALAQELLHVELVGTAMVENGTLTLEAVSVIEPDVLGIDKASGLISFRLEDDPNAPEPSAFADSTAPNLKSWVPGQEHQDKLHPQDSLSLFFNEPLLPSSVTRDTVTLRDGNGSQVAADIRQNGGNVIVKPSDPLEYGKNYEIILDGDVLQDLAGNRLGGTGESLEFSLPATEPGTPTDTGPFVLTSRPGFPCAKADLDPNTFDANNANGRCLGGMTADGGDQTSEWIDRPGDDDLLPLEKHPENKPITVRFSQDMDTGSIKRHTSNSAGTFSIHKHTESGWELVEDYVLETGSRELKAIPMDNWETGAVYRYTLTDGIQSKSGQPLYTKLLAQFAENGTAGRPSSDLTAGGHDLVNRFTVVARNESVLTPLSNLPTRDVNADLRILSPESKVATNDQGETTATRNSAKTLYREGSLDSDLVKDVNIGCQSQGDTPDSEWEDCPTEKFIYKTALLDVEVLKPESSGSGEIPVHLHPSALFTTGLDVHVYIPDMDEATLYAEDEHQVIETGPMLMRMRHQKDEEGNRTELIDGTIKRDSSGQLIFETQLDVYLDAPFMAPDIPLTDLDHNMRSFPINDLKLRGNITFFDDGRMRIEQRNTEKIALEQVLVDGETLGDLGTLVANPKTLMDLNIPGDELYLNYISPASQQ